MITLFVVETCAVAIVSCARSCLTRLVEGNTSEHVITERVAIVDAIVILMARILRAAIGSHVKHLSIRHGGLEIHNSR